MSTVIDAIRHKTFDLKIEVENKEIVLIGYPSEAAGKVLRGKVILTLEEPMKLRAITLNFLGKMKVAWSEGIGHHQHYHKQEKDILEHKWQFVPVMDQLPKKSYTLNQGRHEWDFELSLPGTLPQTLEAEGGQIIYRLKAVVERSVLLQNIVKKQPIRIVRCLSPNAFDLAQSLEIHNTWTEKMMYDILLPSKLYTRGQLIPVTFHITPIAAGLRVRSLTASLKEYCTYSAHDCSKTDTRIIKLHKDEDPFPSAPVRRTISTTTASSSSSSITTSTPSNPTTTTTTTTNTTNTTNTPTLTTTSSNNDIHLSNNYRHSGTSNHSGDGSRPHQENHRDDGPVSWTKVIQLDIPPMSSQAAFCDADNDLIRIRHKMKFIICLANADGHLSELRCSVPIIIVSSVSSENEMNLSSSLPAYDQSWRTVLCMEGPPPPDSSQQQQQQQQLQEYEATTSSSSATSSNRHLEQASQPRPILQLTSTSSSSIVQQEQVQQPYMRRMNTQEDHLHNRSDVLTHRQGNAATTASTTLPFTSTSTPSLIPNNSFATIPAAHIPIPTTSATTTTTANTRPVTTASSTALTMSPISATSPTLSSSPAPSVWWHGTNLSRVPSYRTAAQQEQATFSSSLPTYEQITSAIQAMTTTPSAAASTANNTRSSNNNNTNHTSSPYGEVSSNATFRATTAAPASTVITADNDIIYKKD
ncbi:hypothetical protein BDF20DRAFT_876824 [Mycotypha africana]|uniref:uncharacterized protein n=1 Tax=Mycotypha africana TaxID=64632 RepID=UPI0022FFE80E|nr:uncharacterized protein BDF20DRAFT_876824 [Mycotypha africana]KAI8975082.1 hypothetical protein BDF20DRAFT_876824 [Mycotypha africana]